MLPTFQLGTSNAFAKRVKAKYQGSSTKITGREPGRLYHVICNVACVILFVVLMMKLLPTQSDSNNCEIQTIIAGVLDVAGTCGLVVLPILVHIVP